MHDMYDQQCLNAGITPGCYSRIPKPKQRGTLEGGLVTSGALQRLGHDGRRNRAVHGIGVATPVSQSGGKTNGEAWEHQELTMVLVKVMVGVEEGRAALATYEWVVRRHSERGASASVRR